MAARAVGSSRSARAAAAPSVSSWCATASRKSCSVEPNAAYRLGEPMPIARVRWVIDAPS